MRTTCVLTGLRDTLADVSELTDEDFEAIDKDSDAEDDGSVLNGSSALGVSRTTLRTTCVSTGLRDTLADVSELTDNEEEFIKGKLYGNYCGVRCFFFLPRIATWYFSIF